MNWWNVIGPPRSISCLTSRAPGVSKGWVFVETIRGTFKERERPLLLLGPRNRDRSLANGRPPRARREERDGRARPARARGGAHLGLPVIRSVPARANHRRNFRRRRRHCAPTRGV